MTPFADAEDAVTLVDQLLDLVDEARVIAGGAVVFDARVLPIIAALTSASFPGESGPVDELVFDAGRWVTSRDAAGSLGCSPQWVRELARKGLVRAEQHSGRWLIAKASLDRYAAGKAQPPAKGAQ